MDETTKNELLLKNRRIIDMVTGRAKRDFPEDIALIGLTGSFATGDFHEKSDLDLIIVNDTPRGWDISLCFILGDVGYDIYCTPWETRIEDESRLNSPMVSCLVELNILYCAKPEHMERFNAYRRRALDELAKPIGSACIERAKNDIDRAKREYANAMIAGSEDLGAVRGAAGSSLYHIVNAVVSLNNTYIKRGAKRYLEELLGYEHIPVDFEKKYYDIIDAKTAEELRSASLALLKNADALYHEMREKFAEKPVPTFENLRGTYEELWCNCRNKVIRSVGANDRNYAFHAALGAQDYLDEMTESVGTPKFDLMRSFDPNDLGAFKETFLRAMDAYLNEYEKVGRRVEKFNTFEELYERYMGP